MKEVIRNSAEFLLTDDKKTYDYDGERIFDVVSAAVYLLC